MLHVVKLDRSYSPETIAVMAAAYAPKATANAYGSDL
jgi:hypothetical protein